MVPPTQVLEAVIPGQTYFLGKGHCKGKSDDQGYKVALSEFRQIVASIDATGSQIGTTSPTAQTFAPNSNNPTFTRDDVLQIMGEHLAMFGPNTAALADYNSLLNKLHSNKPATTSEPTKSTTGLIDRFLAIRQTEAQSGQLSIAS